MTTIARLRELGLARAATIVDAAPWSMLAETHGAELLEILVDRIEDDALKLDAVTTEAERLSGELRRAKR